MEKTPAAFFSYTHHDDTHDEGRLTELREKLEGEIRTVTGTKFEIFQDKDAIKWGEQWKKRISAGLGDATFLIAIVTPGYLKSNGCRRELEEFLKHEKKHRRDDLVLPLLYVETAAVSDPTRHAGDSLAEELANRQYKDWRDLRFEPWTNPGKWKRIHELACQVRDALEKRLPAVKLRRRRATKITKPASEATSSKASQEALSVGSPPQPSGPAARNEPKSYVVDPIPGRGDFTSVALALRAAQAGERLLVRPGDYTEPLVLDKPIEIIGDGPREQIILRANGANVVKFATDFSRIANLTLRQEGGGNFSALNVGQGRPMIEDCDITSASLAAVSIHHGAEPTLRRCLIHDGSQGGVLCTVNGAGLLEENDIFGNFFAGVEIREGANPTLRRNRIHDGKKGGVFCHDNGAGLLEENDIFGNSPSGVQISNGANPTLRRNRIHDGKQGGVLCCENGAGLLEHNEIFGNSFTGVEIKEGANPTLRRNRIHDGKQSGVSCHDSGAGLFEDNDIFGNAYAGVVVRSNASPVLRDNRITKNSYEAIWVLEGGRGTFEANDLRGNVRGSWDVEEGSKDRIKAARNLEDPPPDSANK